MSDSSDPFHVMGNDGVIRTLVEHYDGQKDVEEDAYGAWLAIQNQADRIEALEAERDALKAKMEAAVEALKRIADASRFFGIEANAKDHGAEWLAYAHKSTCNLARATLAKIKGEADD